MIAKNKLRRYLFGAAVLITLLLISGCILTIRANALKKNNLKDLATLNEAWEGFNNQSIGQLEKEIKGIKKDILRLKGYFDPKEKWLKKEYDLSIYFAEELVKANQFLKAKAEEKHVDFIDLGLKEKIPSQIEASYLLSQLYGLKEIVNIGMNYSINFKSINPIGLEKPAELPQIKQVKSQLELSCPVEAFAEFIIQLNGLIPRPDIKSLSLKKSEDSFLNIQMSLNHIAIALDWEEEETLPKQGPASENESLTEAVRILRTNNPFGVAQIKESSLTTQQAEQQNLDKDKKVQLSRFLYQGKAILKTKEVVVIEDTLNNEVIFLGKGQNYGNFRLKDFSDEKLILENIDDGSVIVIKK